MTSKRTRAGSAEPPTAPGWRVGGGTLPTVLFHSVSSFLDQVDYCHLQATCGYARYHTQHASAHPAVVCIHETSAPVPDSLLRLRPRRLVYRRASSDKFDNRSGGTVLSQIVDAGMPTTLQELDMELPNIHALNLLSVFAALRSLRISFPSVRHHYFGIRRALACMPKLESFSAPSDLSLVSLASALPPSITCVRAEGWHLASQHELVALCGLPLLHLDVAVELNAGALEYLVRHLPQLRTARFCWSTFAPDNDAVCALLARFAHLETISLRTNQPRQLAAVLSSLPHTITSVALEEHLFSTSPLPPRLLSTDAVTRALSTCRSLSALCFPHSLLSAEQLGMLLSLPHLRRLSACVAGHVTLPPPSALSRFEHLRLLSGPIPVDKLPGASRPTPAPSPSPPPPPPT